MPPLRSECVEYGEHSLLCGIVRPFALVSRTPCSHLVGYVLGQVAPTAARLHHIRQRRLLTVPDAERDVTTLTARASR